MVCFRIFDLSFTGVYLIVKNICTHKPFNRWLKMDTIDLELLSFRCENHPNTRALTRCMQLLFPFYMMDSDSPWSTKEPPHEIQVVHLSMSVFREWWNTHRIIDMSHWETQASIDEQPQPQRWGKIWLNFWQWQNVAFEKSVRKQIWLNILGCYPLKITSLGPFFVYYEHPFWGGEWFSLIREWCSCVLHPKGLLASPLSL